MNLCAASLFAEAADDHHRVDPQVRAFLRDDIFDLVVFSDAVVAPAIPGMDQAASPETSFEKKVVSS